MLFVKNFFNIFVHVKNINFFLCKIIFYSNGFFCIFFLTQETRFKSFCFGAAINNEQKTQNQGLFFLRPSRLWSKQWRIQYKKKFFYGSKLERFMFALTLTIHRFSTIIWWIIELECLALTDFFMAKFSFLLICKVENLRKICLKFEKFWVTQWKWTTEKNVCYLQKYSFFFPRIAALLQYKKDFLSSDNLFPTNFSYIL